MQAIILLQSRPEDAEGEAREGSSRRRRGSSADPTKEKREEAVAPEEGQVGRVGARHRRRQEGEEKAEKEGRLRRRRHRYRNY